MYRSGGHCAVTWDVAEQEESDVLMQPRGADHHHPPLLMRGLGVGPCSTWSPEAVVLHGPAHAGPLRRDLAVNLISGCCPTAGPPAAWLPSRPRCCHFLAHSPAASLWRCAASRLTRHPSRFRGTRRGSYVESWRRRSVAGGAERLRIVRLVVTAANKPCGSNLKGCRAVLAP